MKKIIAVVIVAALLVATPWWMGGIARKRVDHAFESVPKNAPYLKIVESKWTAGWLHSEHVTTFELVLPPGILNVPAALRANAAPAAVAVAAAVAAPPAPQEAPRAPPQFPPLRFSLRDEMLHGPFLGSAGFGLARLDSKIVLSEEIRKKLTEVLGTDDPVQVVTKLSLFAGTTTTVSGKGRSIELTKLDPKAGSGSIAWDDFKLVVGIARHADSYDMDGRLPRIEVRDDKDGDHLLVSDITLKGSSKRIVGDLYDGGATFGIGKFSLATGNKPVVDIDAMEYSFNAGKKDDFMEYAMKFGVGAVHSKDLEATGIQLKETHFDLTMHHLHMATLQKLLAGLREANAKVYQGGADATSATLQPLMEHGVELLKHDPELTIDRLGIVTPQGAGIIKGSVKLEGVTDADISAGVMPLLQKVNADFTIEIAQDLADKIPNGATVVGAGIDGGYLKREGGKLVSHIEYRHGALLVNGKAPEMPQNMQIPGLTPAPPQAAPPRPAAPPKKK